MFAGLTSPGHLIVLLVIFLLLFGAKRIPELAKGLGTGMREFKKSVEGGDEENETRGRRGNPGVGARSKNEADHRDRDGAA